MRDLKEVDLEVKRNGEELEGAEGRETVFRIYCMRQSIFLKREKNNIHSCIYSYL